MTSGASAATFDADVSALEMVRPSAAPLTTGSDLVSSANLRAHSLLSMSRRNSSPPAEFLPLAGTMKPSPGAACTVPCLALSDEVRSHGAATASLAVPMVLVISPSSHEPHQMNRALLSMTACCVVVWSSVAAPGCTQPLPTISASFSVAAFTASDFHALGSRLSIAAIAALPPIFQIHSLTTLWMYHGWMPWNV